MSLNSTISNSTSGIGSSSSSTDIPTALLPLLGLLSSTFTSLAEAINKVPGSPIVIRYIKSSYQDDPYRSLLEVLLVAFALRTVFKGRTRGEVAGKNFVQLTDKEIDELVDDWQPQPLVDVPTELDELTLSSVPVIHGPNGVRVKLAPNGKTVLNLATPDWLGFVESEKMKQVALATLNLYGVGSCGPSGFYGTIDVHTQFEEQVASFLGTESAIIYSQSFATISSAIPAFAKRGDIIVADRGVNFAIHKGLSISRSTIKWYAHNDMKDLERVLQNVEKEQKRKGGRLTKRFIVSEGVFENDGMMVDLPKVMELKAKYKYRLILDESQSFAMVGQGGRGVTEHYGIPAAEVDILIGSMGTGLAAGGGFCAGSYHVCKHQRINSAASVFSAALPAMLATTASAALQILHAQPTIITTLQSNILLFRQILNKLEPAPLPDSVWTSPSSSAISLLPAAHTYTHTPRSAASSPSPAGSARTPVSSLAGASASAATSATNNSANTTAANVGGNNNTSTSATTQTQTQTQTNKDAIIHIPSHPTSALVHIFLLNPPSTLEAEERMLQEVVDEVLGKSDVLITRARRLRGQEAFEPEPSLKVCLSAALSRKEVEKAAKAIKEGLGRVCASEF